MSRPMDVALYSNQDIIDAFKRYDKSPEIEDVILYFISELTGISVDALMEMMH